MNNSNISDFLIAGDLFSDSNSDLSIIDNTLSQLTKDNKLLILNLEGSLKYKNANQIKNKAVPLLIESQLIDLLAKYNVCVSLANNHSSDFGNDSTIYLKKILYQKNIPHFGIFINGDINESFIRIGEDLNKNPIYFVGSGWKNEQCVQSGSNRYGCLNFDFHDLVNVFNHIKAREERSRIFLFSHFGYEYEFWPLPLHVEIARKLIKYGFEGIFSCHTHTIQDFEIFQNKPIYYGLGNFFFSNSQIKHAKDITKGRLVNVIFKSDKLICKNYITEQNLNSNSLTIKKDKESSPSLNKDLSIYSESYKYIRIRKKNPRPILYPQSNIYNYVVYFSWNLIVQILGIIRCRKIVKKLLSW